MAEPLTDHELLMLYGAYCECRPIDITRTSHSHDCDSDELRAFAELRALRQSTATLEARVRQVERERDAARAELGKEQGLCDRCGVAVVGPLEPQLADARAEIASHVDTIARFEQTEMRLTAELAALKERAVAVESALRDSRVAEADPQCGAPADDPRGIACDLLALAPIAQPVAPSTEPDHDGIRDAARDLLTALADRSAGGHDKVDTAAHDLDEALRRRVPVGAWRSTTVAPPPLTVLHGAEVPFDAPRPSSARPCAPDAPVDRTAAFKALRCMIPPCREMGRCVNPVPCAVPTVSAFRVAQNLPAPPPLTDADYASISADGEAARRAFLDRTASMEHSVDCRCSRCLPPTPLDRPCPTCGAEAGVECGRYCSNARALARSGR